MDDFASPGVAENLFIKCDNSLRPFSSIFDKAPTVQEVISFINKSKIKSSSERDLINHYILKNTPYAALISLTDCFNKIIRDGSFPALWKNFSISLIKKPNNKGYRPIALASCVLKLLEKLVKVRLERFIELDYILPKC